jgi:hypothetical protein
MEGVSHGNLFLARGHHWRELKSTAPGRCLGYQLEFEEHSPGRQQGFDNLNAFIL